MNFKKILSLVIVGVVCLSFFSSCGEDSEKTTTTTTTPQPNGTAEKTITVVGQNENMGFWQNVKKGAEEAGKKYGFTVNYVGTDEGTQDDVSTQITSLEKLVTNGVSGVIIAPMGEGYSQTLGKLYDEKIPVVQIDSIKEEDIENLETNNKNPIASTVSTSYKEAGALCAEKMFEAVKEDIKKSENSYTVGVIERDDEKSDEDKATGFIEKFTELADADDSTKGKYKIETESESKYEDALNNLIEDDVKAVFMTHPEVADKVSDMVSADTGKYNEIVFCGFDSGAKQMKWLTEENGPKFIGGVAQDSYNLGFNAVEQCIFAIQGKDVKENVEIEGQWYDKNNAEKMKQDSIIFEK